MLIDVEYSIFNLCVCLFVVVVIHKMVYVQRNLLQPFLLFWGGGGGCLLLAIKNKFYCFILFYFIQFFFHFLISIVLFIYIYSFVYLFIYICIYREFCLFVFIHCAMCRCVYVCVCFCVCGGDFLCFPTFNFLILHLSSDMKLYIWRFLSFG